jgi:hypothetical protein
MASDISLYWNWTNAQPVSHASAPSHNALLLQHYIALNDNRKMVWWHQVTDKSLGEPVRAVFFSLANYHQIFTF